MRKGHHWRDGWYFRRLENGDVEIVQTEYKSDTPLQTVIIPKKDWHSIVASVSRRGETVTTYNVVRRLHD